MIEKCNGIGKIKSKDISEMRDMTLGYNSDEFVIAINKKKDNEYEGVYTIPANKLSEIISLLFGAGVDYQEKIGIDIGFGMGEMDDECTE